MIVETPKAIADFLLVPTPTAWIEVAVEQTADLLVDHANCELKAASTALGLIYRYPERSAFCARLSRLAREELRHFERVRKLMQQLSIPFEKLSASRYANGLREGMRTDEPYRLLDSLIIAALIEARSCERFAVLAPHLKSPLQNFYTGLLASEARHFENYLGFAKSECAISNQEFESRLDELKATEAALVMTPDRKFRFHSGPPAGESGPQRVTSVKGPRGSRPR